MTLEIVQSLPEDQWRAYVDQHPHGSIFHTPDMYAVYQRAHGYQPELWAALEQGRILALMTPVNVCLSNSPLRYLTSRSIVYGGVLCEDTPAGQAALAELLHAYQSDAARKALFTEIRNLVHTETLQPILHQAGFRFEDHLNYWINLDRPTAEIFESIGQRTRRNLRRGLRRGLVTVEAMTQRELMPVCYQLMQRVYQNAHVPLADISLFYAAYDLLCPKKMIHFSLARFEDQPVAVSVELSYRHVLFGWFSGLDRSYSAYVPNELLMWYILEWGAKRGYRLFDFGGAGKPDERYGVRDFKAKFGGELVNLGRNTWVPYPPLLTLSKLGYSILRRFLYAR